MIHSYQIFVSAIPGVFCLFFVQNLIHLLKPSLFRDKFNDKNADFRVILRQKLKIPMKKILKSARNAFKIQFLDKNNISMKLSWIFLME